MTKNEFIEKYGDILVSFSSYYKYLFTFSGTTEDGNHIIVSVGGDADEIYRLDISSEKTPIKYIDADSGSVYVDGVQIESFEDF